MFDFIEIYKLGDLTKRFSFILASIGVFSLFLNYYLNYYFNYSPKITLSEAVDKNENLINYFDDEAIKSLEDSFKLAKKFEYLQIDPIILLDSIGNIKEGKYIFLRIDITKPEQFSGIVLKELRNSPKGKGEIMLSDSTNKCLSQAVKYAISNGKDKITIGDLLLGIFSVDKAFQEIIFKLKIKKEDLLMVINWYNDLAEKTKKIPFWQKKSFGSPMAQDWAFGYTPQLNQFAYDMNEAQEGKAIHIYSRDKEISELERILSKTAENNALLVGEKGIGKKSIIEGLVQKIKIGDVMGPLNHCHVYKINTAAILSGVGRAGEIEARLTLLFNEAVRAGNIILFIEDFHSLVSSNKEVGQINASEILSPYLKGGLRIIATTTNKKLHEDIEANPGINAVFEKIDVKETDKKTTLKILQDIIPYIETRSRVFFSYQDLKEIILLSERYVSDKPFPEKAIDLMDEVSVKAAQQGARYIDIKLIDQIVSEKTEVPVAEPEGGEKEKLINLEKILHERIIGQNEAINVISNAMRRARSGLAPEDRPIGTFLFLGPTGVGKTETAKALAEAYFGSEKNMVRFDMSEFQDQTSLSRLIGSAPAPGHPGTKGELVTSVKDKPFSLVLLDEIEKANKEILTLFLQVFDEGYLSSGSGEKINFKNTIIICTSNAGSELIRENLKKGTKEDDLKQKLLDFLQSQGIFRPEFLNRFDGVVAFHPLSSENIKEVAKLMLEQLSERMKEKDIIIKFTDKAVEKLAKTGFDPVYGARPMRRTIQEKVENSIAQKLLSGEIKRGDKIVLDEKDI